MIERRILLSLILFTFFINCKSKKEESGSDKTIEYVVGTDTLVIPKETKTLDGKQLSMIYCQQCHTYPDPAFLEKDVWEKGILPRMGLRLGIDHQELNPLNGLSFKEMEIIYAARIFPTKPLISKEDWNKIVKYYTTQAPDSIAHPEKRDAKSGLKSFNVIIPKFNYTEPVDVSLLKFDSLSSTFYVGDSDKKLSILNNKGEHINTLETKSPAVDIEVRNGEGFYVLNIGNLSPTDLPTGLFSTVINGKKFGSLSRVLLGGLKRPVDFSIGKLNEDTLPDIVVSSFGFYTGSLSWYENKGVDTYKEHVLRAKPGAQKTIIKDLNNDGLIDIVALMSQGDEGIFAYYNQGSGKFKEENLLRFSPINGSNYFDLVDFNKDGFLDILYVNGDNADYSYSLKSYHGISIYLNDGKNNFQRKWFYPLYGASKAIASDFDKDGDLDIAAIAFFADFEHDNPLPFVYLKNEGEYNFVASTLEDPLIGRWLTMESGDFDKDGDEDIALGKYITSPSPVPIELLKKWRESSPYILILDNKLKRKSN
ncbi:MAG TPA: VCBS repeat-containing protein [Cytophagales bacterium]|nr:VCBS repeat-containing protein [Cytophagales bacterium]